MTRKKLIILAAIVLLQLLGCASPRHSTLVVIAEGQAGRHTSLRPTYPGIDAETTAGATIRAEYHLWQ